MFAKWKSNDDAIISATHAHRGDVVKLIGDGTLAIFTAEDRTHMQRGIVGRDRRAAKCGRVEKAPGFGRQARNRHVSRFACR